MGRKDSVLALFGLLLLINLLFVVSATCAPEAIPYHCSSISPISVYHCDSNTGMNVEEICRKNIFGVQFVCQDGQCVYPPAPDCTIAGQTGKPGDEFCPLGVNACNNHFIPFVGTHIFYCKFGGDTSLLYSAKFTSDCSYAEASWSPQNPGYQCSNGDWVKTVCGAGQTLCSDGSCQVSCDGHGGIGQNITDQTCKSCDAFVFSEIFGSFWQSKQCNARPNLGPIGILFSVFNFFIPAIPSTYPQTNTTCVFSWLKIAVAVLVFAFVLLFGLQASDNFRKRNLKILAIIIVIFLSGFLAFIAFQTLWLGVILGLVFIVISAFLKMFVPTRWIK